MQCPWVASSRDGRRNLAVGIGIQLNPGARFITMTISLLFWILMLLWAVFGVFPTWPKAGGPYWSFGGSLLLFILIGMLGWRVFGPAIRG